MVLNERLFSLSLLRAAELQIGKHQRSVLSGESCLWDFEAARIKNQFV